MRNNGGARISYCTDSLDTGCTSSRPDSIADGAWVYAKNTTETDDYLKAQFEYGVGFKNVQKHVPPIPEPTNHPTALTATANRHKPNYHSLDRFSSRSSS